MTAKTEKYETFTSSKAKYADLRTQLDRLKEVEEKNRTDADSLRALLQDAEEAHRACEKLHMRGVASTEELAAAKALTGSLRDQLADAERMTGLAQDGLTEMQAEISDARSLARDSFAACCVEIQTGIATALNSDTKIRAKLLEAYAGWAHSGAQHHGKWPEFVAGIFSPPSSEEIQSAIAEFKPKHRLE